jgi:hypothetical protein
MDASKFDLQIDEYLDNKFEAPQSVWKYSREFWVFLALVRKFLILIQKGYLQ